MKKTLLTALLLTMVVAVQGQGRGRPWTRGALRIEDFGVIAASGRENSHLDYAIVFSPTGVTEGNNTYLYCRTAAVMYSTASWMAEGHADEAELTYNQALFDIVEVHRRQMQREAMLLSKRGQYELLLSTTKMNLDREIQEVQAATEGGRDSLVLERIRVKNREWLNANPCERPEFTLKPYWLSLSLDYGADITMGNLAHHYTTSIGSQTFCAAIGWDRHGLYYRLMSGTMNTYDTIPGISPVSNRVDITFGYGFTLLDRPSYSVTPYLAYGISDFDFWTGENLTFGVRGNYHFHHWHRITNAVKGKGRRLTASATADLYLSRITLDETGERSGLSLGIHLGLNFISRNEKVTW